jgi:hypothetical protein
MAKHGSGSPTLHSRASSANERGSTPLPTRCLAPMFPSSSGQSPLRSLS